ncbi:hypothetical protein, partial [Micromonospora sp. KC207]|uniref:hypothetical protein n=1 Tax=Micromonospora sp. KC207 TaxID=2530377 RepID=UPI001A9EF908
PQQLPHPRALGRHDATNIPGSTCSRTIEPAHHRIITHPVRSRPSSALRGPASAVAADWPPRW